MFKFFLMLSFVKIDYLYVFGRLCLSVLYKIEVIMQYCASNFLNLQFKALTSDIILLLWCTVEK